MPVSRRWASTSSTTRRPKTATSKLGAKGVGEVGTAGAPAAVMNALNDALTPFAVTLTDMPFTPEKILRALGRVGRSGAG